MSVTNHREQAVSCGIMVKRWINERAGGWLTDRDIAEFARQWAWRAGHHGRLALAEQEARDVSKA